MYDYDDVTEITEMNIDPAEVFGESLAEEAWEWANEHDDLKL